MQNDGQKFSRREYNKKYYQEHKAKILGKRKSSPEMTTVAGPPSPKKTNVKQLIGPMIRGMEFLILAFLTAIMTYLLIKESAGFYLDANETPLAAYLKAGMVELTAVLFSFSRTKNTMIQWGQRSVVVMLCGLSLWTMSARVTKNASLDSAKAIASQKLVQALESERAQKESLREQLLTRGWLGATRKYEKTLDQLRDKLATAQMAAAETQAPKVIATGLGVLITFRLILLISNLICIHRLAEFFTLETLQKRRV